MNLIEIQRGLRQVVMALMFWAIDVPQKLLQSDAIPILINLSHPDKINNFNNTIIIK